jgi:hypothetical protein
MTMPVRKTELGTGDASIGFTETSRLMDDDAGAKNRTWDG